MRLVTQPLLASKVLYAVVSFGMTFFRIGIALYIGLCVLLGMQTGKEIAVIGTACIMILDYYDGLFFSKSVLRDNKQWRVRRRIFDSVADRLVIQIVSIPILLIDQSFLWLYLAILLRETVLSVYSAKLFKNGFLVYPGPLAKLACAFVGLSGIAFLLTNIAITLAFAMIMMLLSCFSYVEYRNKMRCYQMKEAASFAELNITEVF